MTLTLLYFLAAFAFLPILCYLEIVLTGVESLTGWRIVQLLLLSVLWPVTSLLYFGLCHKISKQD